MSDLSLGAPFAGVAANTLIETDHWLRRVCLGAKPGTKGAALEAFRIADHTELARHLHTALAKEKVCYDMGEIWRYRENGVWTPIPFDFVQSLVWDLSGAPVWHKDGTKPIDISLGKGEDTATLLGRMIKATEGNPIFDPPVLPRGRARFGLGFHNGYLTVVDGAPILVPHAPENMCRFSFDFAYAPDVPHPLLDRFFDVAFRGEDAENRKRLEMVLQEFVGACLFGEATHYECALVLEGEGGNGKSEFLNIARAVFPSESVSAIPPHEWGNGPSLYGLAGKLANFVDEVDDKEISVGASLKKVVSGQPCHVDRKYRDPVTFSPRCGNIFNVNRLFGTSDTTDGFHRRFKIVPFHHRPLPHERVPRIGERIAHEERRALVAWAVRGYLRLKKQGGYSEVARVRQRTVAWEVETDNVRLFLFAAYETHKEAPRLSVADLFKMYQGWCKDYGAKPLSLHRFTKRCRETKMMIDAKDRFGSGFSWNHPTVRELVGLMGDEAPEWGTVTEPASAGTYAKAGGL